MNNKIKRFILSMVLISILMLGIVSYVFPTTVYADCNKCSIPVPIKSTPTNGMYKVTCCCYRRTYICLYCKFEPISYRPACYTDVPTGCEWRTIACCQYPCPMSIVPI